MLRINVAMVDDVANKVTQSLIKKIMEKTKKKGLIIPNRSRYVVDPTDRDHLKKVT